MIFAVGEDRHDLAVGQNAHVARHIVAELLCDILVFIAEFDFEEDIALDMAERVVGRVVAVKIDDELVVLFGILCSKDKALLERRDVEDLAGKHILHD